MSDLHEKRVEAAAKAAYEFDADVSELFGKGFRRDFDGMPQWARDTHLDKARAALEAADAVVTELDAAVAATSERAAVPDAQAERVSMEVLNEYRRIAAWLESQAALRGATGDTMHGLAAEALAILIDHEYSRHTIPLYGICSTCGGVHESDGEFESVERCDDCGERVRLR